MRRPVFGVNQFKAYPMQTSKNTHLNAAAFWETFGFITITDPESDALIGIVPEGVIALLAVGQRQIDTQTSALQAIGIVPDVMSKVREDAKLVLYRLDGSLSLQKIKDHFGDRTKVLGAGDPVQLPSDPLSSSILSAHHVDQLSVLSSLEEYRTSTADDSDDDLPVQISGGTPLDQYSLLGKGADLEKSAAKNVPLLGGVVLSGQATVVYAPPNSGKTLLTLSMATEAVEEGRLCAERCYYINADDSQLGLAEKIAILDEVGIHTISPGSLDFKTSKLIHIMAEMVDNDDCGDTVIIVDTLKKFVDLMDKKSSAAFGDTVRQFVLKGGTFFALAHTRKNVGANGDLVYGGTSDFMEDFDAACILAPSTQRSSKDEKLVQFQFQKRRGCNVDEVYAYDDNPASTYVEKFLSVRLVQDDEGEWFYHEFPDADVIAAIRYFIGAGSVQKMKLVRAVAMETGMSRRSAMQVLERYTGDDPERHQWFFAIKERGAKVYQVHPLREPDV
jgi:hypothetical protein